MIPRSYQFLPDNEQYIPLNMEIMNWRDKTGVFKFINGRGDRNVILKKDVFGKRIWNGKKTNWNSVGLRFKKVWHRP